MENLLIIISSFAQRKEKEDKKGVGLKQPREEETMSTESPCSCKNICQSCKCKNESVFDGFEMDMMGNWFPKDNNKNVPCSK